MPSAPSAPSSPTRFSPPRPAHPPRTPRPGSPVLPFGVAFAAVAIGFLASTFYVETRSSAIDREIAQMELNSVPSVAHLSSARVALRHVQNGLEHFAHVPASARAAAKAKVLASETELDREVAAELETPNYPGETEAYALAKQSIGEIETAIADWFAATPGDAPASDIGLDDTFDRAHAALTVWASINGSHQDDEIAMIKEVRGEALHLALLLDGACAVLATLAAFLALRALTRQRAAEDAHEKLLVGRANELEMFAKQVAHDLLSPLSSLAFLLGSIRSNAAKGAPVGDAISRADACLKRSQRLVGGALEFARSGATKGGTGRSDLREAINGVLDEVRSDDEHATEDGPAIAVDPFPRTVLACDAGVLTSVLSNLVRNAVKFTEGRELRRIMLRVTRIGSAARVEVEDTGPGLPAGLEGSLFEPYVRGVDAKPGLGLGLATVRRFVEAYGGKVGVVSSPARGCVFWFELPVVETPSRAT